MLTKDWFTAANLTKWFLTRVNDDVGDAGAFAYWDGYRGISMQRSKVGMLSVGGSYGDLIRVRMTILGFGITSEEDMIITSKPSAGTINDNPASFYNVVASGGLSTTKDDTKSFSSFDITFNNNLDVEPELSETQFAQEVNSGQLTGTMRLVFQAKRTPPSDGTSCGFTITPPGGSPTTITVPNPVSIDDQERTIQFPRQMRERNYILMGNGGPNVPIVSFA
jgi:archaellin